MPGNGFYAVVKTESDERPEVDLARLELREQRVAIRDLLIDDALELRLAAPIVRIRLQLDRVSALPRDVAKRPDPDRFGVIGRGIDVRQVAENVLRQNARVCAGAREKDRHVRCEWFLEVKYDGVSVRLIDLLDQIPAVAANLVVFRIEHGFGREHDVVGVKWRPIRPFHATPQVPGNRLVFSADPPLGLSRHFPYAPLVLIAAQVAP